MNFAKYIFLVFLASIFFAGTSFAEEYKVSKEEKRMLEVSKRAFQDKLYDVASTQLEAFCTTYPDSPSQSEVLWLLGQSYYFLSNNEQALKTFTQLIELPDPDLKFRKGALFWQAEVYTALQNWGKALDQYNLYLQKYPNDTNFLLARLGKANALFHSDERDKALKILNELQALGSSNPIGQKAILIKTQMLIAQDKPDQAKTTLDLLPIEDLKPPILFDTLYWQSELALVQNKPDQALEYLKKITDDQRASPRSLVVQAWLTTGEALSVKENWKDAANAYQKAFSITQDEKTQQLAMKKFIEAHQKNQSTATGALELRSFVEKNGESAAVGLYILGDTFRQAENYDAAISELNSLIKTFPKSKWSLEAQLLIAKILVKKDQSDAAETVLKKMIEQDNDPTQTRNAQFYLAELYFNQKDFTKAAEIYQSLASEDSEDKELLEHALFNALVTFSHAKQIDAFETTEEKFRELFPKSSLLEDITLEKSRLLETLNRSQESQEILKEFIQENPKGEKTAQALFLEASSLYYEGKYKEASKSFQRIVKKFPDSDFRVDAAYHKILSDLRSGSVSPEEARKALSKLFGEFPKDELSPSIQFQIAQSYYEQQNFGEAQRFFDAFSQKYPDHPLKDDAIYFSGKSLMWLTNYQEAISTFEKIPDTSPLKPDSRLAEIDCYRLLGNFEAALKIADSLIERMDKTNPLWVDANLRKANCLFTMAGDDKSLYQKTLDVTNTILQNPGNATLPQLNETGFIKAKCFEKLGQPNEALQAYLNVVYRKLLPDVEASSQPEYRWFTRCGIEAAKIKEDQKDIEGAISIYKILERLSGPNRQDFSQKIQDLKTRHFIWSEE